MEGKMDELKGRVKKAAGELSGNDRLKAEGQVDKTAGKIKSGVSKTVDAVKDTLNGR